MGSVRAPDGGGVTDLQVCPWICGVPETFCADGCLRFYTRIETSCHFQLDRGGWRESRSRVSHSGWVTLLSPTFCPAGVTQSGCSRESTAHRSLVASWHSCGSRGALKKRWLAVPVPAGSRLPGFPLQAGAAFFCLFFKLNTCLLSAYYVPGTALST